MSANKQYKKTPKRVNSYNHLAVVVLRIDEKVVDDRKQFYASGYDLKSPDKKVSVALMKEEGLKKHVAQVHLGVFESTVNGKKEYYRGFGNKAVSMERESYEKFLESDPQLASKVKNEINSRKSAEGLEVKRTRTALPAVMMFDNANKLGMAGDIAIYEAKWISGISGTTSELEADKNFSISHREVMGNVSVKYNESNKPIWADINAVDRVMKLAPLTTNLSEYEFSALRTHNGKIVAHALSNSIKSAEGYEAERKPFTYFVVDFKDSDRKMTVGVYNEEVEDSRLKADDQLVKHNFKRPLSNIDTLKAYTSHTDRLSQPLNEILRSKTTLSSDVPEDVSAIKNAIKSDNARAVISSLMLSKFQPLVSKDLVERCEDKEMAAIIMKAANVSEHLYGTLRRGNAEITMINGTTYPVGPKYLKRFVEEATNSVKPLSGAVQIVPDQESGTLRIVPHDQNRNLVFSKMIINPQRWENESDKPSSFVSLVTVEGQSVAEVAAKNKTHMELTEKDSPKAESFRFIQHEYAEYATGEKTFPNVFDVLEQEKERVSQIQNESQLQVESDKLYRLLGDHKVPVVPVKSQEPGIEKAAPAPVASFDLG